MTDLIILGAGGHGKVIADTAEQLQIWDTISFLDDRFKEGMTHIAHWPVIGNIHDFKFLNPKTTALVIGIGNNSVRANLFELINSMGFDLPNIIHPTAYISPHCQLSQGSVFFAQSAVNISASVGNACIINTAATIDHDCIIGNFCHISPGAHLAGGCHIGDRSWLGIGSVTKQQIKIGQDCMVGAGAAVTQNVYNHSIVIGVPAKLKS